MIKLHNTVYIYVYIITVYISIPLNNGSSRIYPINIKHNEGTCVDTEIISIIINHSLVAS